MPGPASSEENCSLRKNLSSSGCSSKHAIRQVFFKCELICNWFDIEASKNVRVSRNLDNQNSKDSCPLSHNLWVKGNVAWINWSFCWWAEYSTTLLYNQHSNLYSTSSTSLTNGGVLDVDCNKPRQTRELCDTVKPPGVTDENIIGHEKNRFKVKFLQQSWNRTVPVLFALITLSV